MLGSVFAPTAPLTHSRSPGADRLAVPPVRPSRPRPMTPPSGRRPTPRPIRTAVPSAMLASRTRLSPIFPAASHRTGPPARDLRRTATGTRTDSGPAAAARPATPSTQNRPTRFSPPALTTGRPRPPRRPPTVTCCRLRRLPSVLEPPPAAPPVPATAHRPDSVAHRLAVSPRPSSSRTRFTSTSAASRSPLSPPPPPRPAPVRKALSLDEYLRRGNGRQG